MAFKVLIIDDDDAYRHIIERRLTAILGQAEFTTFSDITSARRSLETATRPLPFDLVILDEHLPDGSGVALLAEGLFADLTVFSISSDEAPEIPGAAVKAGAAFFLSKRQISDPLFKPLILGAIDRNRTHRELIEAKINEAILNTVKTLVKTLRHEINNPLGAVLGAAYILKGGSISLNNSSDGSSVNQPQIDEQVKEAARLVEASGRRIKEVLDELCNAVKLDQVSKADQLLFQIPGDPKWGK